MSPTSWCSTVVSSVSTALVLAPAEQQDLVPCVFEVEDLSCENLFFLETFTGGLENSLYLNLK